MIIPVNTLGCWGEGYVPRNGFAESKGRMSIVKPWMFDMTACLSCASEGTGEVGERTVDFCGIE